MSKLLLILDSTKLKADCLNCPCRYEYVGGVICMAAHEDVECEYIPDWCPLHPMPEKKDVRDASVIIRQAQKEDINPGYYNGWLHGWNACIDAILGGRDENGC